jgi:hypothetical protein
MATARKALASSHTKLPKKPKATKTKAEKPKRPAFVPAPLQERECTVKPIAWPKKARELAGIHGLELPKPRRWLLSCDLPIRVESEANRREHYMIVKKRVDEQRAVTMAVVGEAITREEMALPPRMAVVLTRIGPKTLDDDNLARGFKHVRDAIAYLLGIDDGLERVRYEYQQRKGKPKEYAARVDFYEVGE